MVRAEVKKAFNPEFLNRLDEVILFSSLTDADLIQIIDLMVEQINGNLVAKQVKLRLTEDAAKYILEKTCGDRSYGARPLRRALQKYIEDPLSESELEVYLGETGIFYRVVSAEVVNAEGEAAVTAGAAEAPAGPAPGTLLYTF
jgi:ATP-dependent Clp protease ATP-binding subunit ClpC